MFPGAVLRPGIVTGTRLEARCVLRVGELYRIACSGANAQAARLAAEHLIVEGFPGLVSFGLAGALSGDHEPGDLILAQAVILPGGQRCECDAPWRRRVERRLDAAGLKITTGTIAGSERMLADPQDKAHLGRATGALAVDMESHATASAADAADVPCLVLRAIADGLQDRIPAAAQVAVGSNGAIRYLALAATLASRPGDVASLLRLARAGRAGLDSLRRAAELLGPAAFGLL